MAFWGVSYIDILFYYGDYHCLPLSGSKYYFLSGEKMKKVSITIAVGLLLCLLAGCSTHKETTKDSKENTVATTSKMNPKSNIKTKKSFNVEGNPYAHQRVSMKNTTFKAGDYQEQNGLSCTYLTDLIDIPEYSSNNVDFTNIQYVISLIGLPNDDSVSLSDIFKGNYSYGKGLFDEKTTNLDDSKYITILTLETDIKNNNNENITFDGLTGKNSSEFYWTIPEHTQVSKDDIFYSDDTKNIIQANSLIEDKDVMIVLSSGNTPKEAAEKIPNGKMTIRTSGFSKDYSNIGGEHAIDLSLNCLGSVDTPKSLTKTEKKTQESDYATDQAENTNNVTEERDDFASSFEAQYGR